MAYVLVATRIPGEQAEYLDTLIGQGIASNRADAIRKIIQERMKADDGRNQYEPLPYVQKREHLAPPRIPNPGGNRFNSQPKFVMYHSPNPLNRAEGLAAITPEERERLGIKGDTINELAEAYEKVLLERYGAVETEIRRNLEDKITITIEPHEGNSLEIITDKAVLEASEDDSSEPRTVIVQSIGPIIGEEENGSVSEIRTRDPPKIGEAIEERSSEDPPKIIGENVGISEESSSGNPDIQNVIIPEGPREDGEAEPRPVLPSDPSPRPTQKNYFGIGQPEEPDFTGWTEAQIEEYRRMFPRRS